MKQKLLSGFLISFVFSASGHGATVTGTDLNIGTGNTLTSGSNATAAIGEYNDSSYGGLAVGSSNVSGEGSFTIGANNVAYAYSMAGGGDVVMDSNSAASLMFGELLQAADIYTSVIFGRYNKVNQNSVGLPSGGIEESLLLAGSSNKVYRPGGVRGYDNIVLGKSNVMDSSVSGASTTMNASLLIGLDNFTSKTESWVIGKGNIGQTGTLTLGTYASEVTNAALIVGRGTAANARLNGLVVLKDGAVQIPGTLEIGGEQALTATSATAAGYLKRISGTGATGGSSSLLVLGSNATAAGSAVAMGNNSAATGTSSFSLGGGSKAQGLGAMSFGYYADATAVRSTAVGYYSQSTAQFSTAVGYYAKSAGEYSHAFGGEALGLRSLALGGGKANADYSTASMGGVASGVGAIAISTIHPTWSGTATSSGVAATAIGGVGPVASGDVSFTSGFQTKSSAAHSAVFGSRNLSAGTGLVPADNSSWVLTESLFEVGNGKPTATPAVYSNAITTLKNGRTTLTNSSWSSGTPLAVPSNATESSNGEALVVDGHTRLNGKVILTEAQGDISMGIYQ